MLEELATIPRPPMMNTGMLNRAPDHAGLQHDEVKASLNGWFPAWWPRLLRFGWKPRTRAIKDGAALHPSVLARFAATAVPSYDAVGSYRPQNLRQHGAVSALYS